METKKKPEADFRKQRPAFLFFGLLVSLSMAFMAFEWKQDITETDLSQFEQPNPFDEYEPPPTVINPPPPPPPPKPVVIIETIEEPLEKPDLTKLLPEFEPDTSIPNFVPDPMPVEPDPQLPFIVAETAASFVGGNAAWGKFLRKNLKYPKKARKISIEGRVFLKFQVDVDGSISDIEVIRGIGGGCDEEAVRVLKKSPKWNPGLQRGRAVKSRMSLMVLFRLK